MAEAPASEQAKQKGPRVAFIPAGPGERPFDRNLADQQTRARFGEVAARLDLALLRAASHVGGSQGLLLAQLAIEALVEHKRMVPATERFNYGDAEELLDKEQIRVWLVPVALPGPPIKTGVAVAVSSPPGREHLPHTEDPAKARRALLQGLRSLEVKGLPQETDMRKTIIPEGQEPAAAESQKPAQDLPGLVELIRSARLAPVFLFDGEPCTPTAFELECRRMGLQVDRADCGDY